MLNSTSVFNLLPRVVFAIKLLQEKTTLMGKGFARQEWKASADLINLVSKQLGIKAYDK